MIVTVRKKMADAVIPEHLRAATLVPVLAYHEDERLFLLDDHSLGFGFLCRPLCGGDEKVQERMSGLLNQDYPCGTIVQFVLFRSPDIEREIQRMMNLRRGFDDPLLRSVLRARAGFLRRHTMERLETVTRGEVHDSGLIQDLKLFVTCKIPLSSTHPDRHERRRGVELATRLEAALRAVGLCPVVMTAADYIRILGTMLNWGPRASWRDGSDWERDKPICAQIFDWDNDLEVSGDGLRLGDRHVRVLSAKRLPECLHFGEALSYAGERGGGHGVEENYMVVSNVYFPDTEKTRNALERKRQFTVNQAFGPLLEFVPVLADKKKGFDVLYDSMKDGERPVRITYSLVVFAADGERAAAAATAARNVWRGLGFDLMEDRFVALPVFLNCLPLCGDRRAVASLFRYKTMTSAQAAVLAPVFGDWKGTGTFHAALISRNGQLMSLSLHDSETNKNAVIAAESGSGKSFLINELILSYLSEGARVWVIDAGKSYQKLAATLRGDFICFAEETRIRLNPFELVARYEEEEDAIVNLVRTMASEKGLLDEWQLSALKQTLSRLWREKGGAMRIDDIAARCLEGEDRRLRDIGQQLYAFTSNGSYGKYFSGGNTVSFGNRFTVLELDELQGRKHLRQVVLLQLIYRIQQEILRGARDRKKLVIVDEAWDLLKGGEVSAFMEYAYRRFRKYGGSVVIATQSVNDLYENAVGRAIAENSANMYLLGQTAESVESLRRSGRLALSEGAFRTLAGVRTIQGAYSELFVRSNAGMGVGRLIVSEFQKLLYSSDPDDVSAIDRFVRRGMEVSEAIAAVLRDRGRDVRGEQAAMNGPVERRDGG